MNENQEKKPRKKQAESKFELERLLDVLPKKSKEVKQIDKGKIPTITDHLLPVDPDYKEGIERVGMPELISIKALVLKKIRLGYSREHVVRFLQANGFTRRKATDYYAKAITMVKKETRELAKTIAEDNIRSLNQVKELALASADMGLYMRVIEQLNKLAGINNQTIEIDNADNSTKVKIRFGNELDTDTESDE